VIVRGKEEITTEFFSSDIKHNWSWPLMFLKPKIGYGLGIDNDWNLLLNNLRQRDGHYVIG